MSSLSKRALISTSFLETEVDGKFILHQIIVYLYWNIMIILTRITLAINLKLYFRCTGMFRGRYGRFQEKLVRKTAEGTGSKFLNKIFSFLYNQFLNLFSGGFILFIFRCLLYYLQKLTPNTNQSTISKRCMQPKITETKQKEGWALAADHPSMFSYVMETDGAQVKHTWFCFKWYINRYLNGLA